MTEEHRPDRDDDPDRLADELEHDADRLEEKSEELGDEIEDTKRDWEAKRRDRAVPGAPPPADGEQEAPGGDAGSEDADR